MTLTDLLTALDQDLGISRIVNRQKWRHVRSES